MSEPISIETVEGTGEAVLQDGEWLVTLPWTDYRFVGTRAEVLRTVEQKQAEYLKALWLNFVEGFQGNLESELENASKPSAWLAEGFTPEQYKIWAAIGAFDPAGAKALDEAGFDMDVLARKVSFEEAAAHSLSYSGLSIAYMFCNGDLTLEGIKQLTANNN